jgi:hypothetical protein
MIFASTMLYALARKYGLQFAAEEFMRQVKAAAEDLAEQRRRVALVGGTALKPPEAPAVYIPAANTIARVALLGEMQVNVNAGATVIAKARTIAAHEFLASPCGVWVSCDDDVEVSADALATMVAQCEAEPSIVIAPCLLRDTHTVNVDENLVRLETKGANGGKLSRVAAGGFGCFAISREALQAVLVAHDFPEWTDEKGVSRRVLFRDEVIGGKWYTEDTAFFRRVPAHVRVYAVRTGYTVHNGQILDCDTLEALVPAAGQA